MENNAGEYLGQLKLDETEKNKKDICAMYAAPWTIIKRTTPKRRCTVVIAVVMMVVIYKLFRSSKCALYK